MLDRKAQNHVFYCPSISIWRFPTTPFPFTNPSSRLSLAATSLTQLPCNSLATHSHLHPYIHHLQQLTSLTPSTMSSTTTTTTTTVPKPLPNPRLVRNGYDAVGRFVFTHDAALSTYTPFGPQGSAFAIFDRRDAVPAADNLDPVVPSFGEALSRCPPGRRPLLRHRHQARGARAHAPHAEPRLLLRPGRRGRPGARRRPLDGGQGKKTLRAGDVVVQQGANHAWLNASDDVCRILCAVVGAEEVQLTDGRALDETAFEGLPRWKTLHHENQRDLSASRA